MSKKFIYYKRTNNHYTLSKESFSKEGFEKIIPLFEDHLHLRGLETFDEFLKSYTDASAAAAAFSIGGKVLRRKSFEKANEVNGKEAIIDFIIDTEQRTMEIKSNLTDEGIGLELKILDLHHYAEDVVKQENTKRL